MVFLGSMATDLPDFGAFKRGKSSLFGGQARFVGPIPGIGSGWLDRAKAAKWVDYTLTIRTSKREQWRLDWERVRSGVVEYHHEEPLTCPKDPPKPPLWPSRLNQPWRTYSTSCPIKAPSSGKRSNRCLGFPARFVRGKGSFHRGFTITFLHFIQKFTN